MPEINVIVPVFNNEKYLSRCIDSILNQSFADYELILVDDGSTDNSGQICDNYRKKDKRIRVIHQNNLGQATARNRAVDMVCSKRDSGWITFVDSDDWIHPKYIELLKEAAVSKGTDISACNIMRVKNYQVNSVSEPVQIERIRSSELCLEYAKMPVNVSLCGKLFNKCCFSQFRLPDGRLWEDLATTYRLIMSSKYCSRIHEALYYYYFNSEGTVNRSWYPQRMDELLAYEEQLAFWSRQSEYQNVFVALQGTYIRAIGYSYFLEQKSDINSNEKKYYARELQNKMRSALRRYGRTADISFWKDTTVYETAYPRLMQIYWIIRSQIDKIKKVLKNEP